MANEPIIKTFGAADIEKYHKGQLSAREMHDLEKAALDDPFLADALEGYAIEGVAAASDMEDLKKRLAARTTGEQEATPAAVVKKSSFYWLRIAAMIVVVAGAGFLVYRLAFTNQRSDIAQFSPQSNTTGGIIDSNKLSGTLPPSDTTSNVATTLTPGLLADSTRIPVINSQTETNSYLSHKDSLTVSDGYYANTASPPRAAIAQEKEQQNDGDLAALDKKRDDFVKNEQNKRTTWHKADSLEGVFGYTYTAPATNLSRKAKNQNHAEVLNGTMNNQSYNVFRGRVTDAANNALPFANITNTADNVGTYADGKGYFTLTSPDSVLNVQVRSLGFENNTIQLQNNVPQNQVTLEEDKSLAEVVISSKQVNSLRSRNATMTLEEPEPVDGWVNYDTYLANNLVMPETFRSKQASGGEVKLSFEVNKSGEPVNITVDQSLCASCDKEAIRLIKEGPKWKRKARKGRTSVTISF